MKKDDESNVREQQRKLANKRFFPVDRFSESLEREFRQYRHERLLERIPAIGTAGFFIFILFSFLDYFTLPEPVYLITIAIRLFIVCPLIALAIISARLNWSINNYTLVYMTAYVVSGLSIVVIMFVTRISNTEMPYDGVLLHLVFGYFLMGSPYTLATFGGVLVSVGYFSLEFILDAPDHVLISNAAFITTLNFMGAIGSYMQERSRRSLFLNQKLVDLAKAKDEQEISSRTRLLATASHDLRQPLHAMNLLVESLEGQVPKGDSLALTQKLKTAINQLSQLLSSLLNISRLNVGIVETKIVSFDLSTLVQSLIPEQKLRADEIGISISTNGPSPCLIKSDPILIERIFRNLCENIFAHAEASAIEISWYKQEDSIVLEVEDNGKGIPEDEMDRIFDEFHQTDQSNKQGMGLGLAIVKQLSDLLSIRYGVKKGKSKGACFWLKLEQAYSVDMPSIENAPYTAHTTSGKNILLVDDDLAIVESCEILLKKWGYKVTSTQSPEQALNEIKDRHFDLLVCDYRFPTYETNGIELIMKARAHIGSNLPAILITADTQEEVGEEVTQTFLEKDLKITGIAFKPLAPAKLKLIIQHYI